MDTNKDETLRRFLLEAIKGSPEEAAKICSETGDKNIMASALAIACRWLGFDYAKALIDAGATFDSGTNAFYFIMLMDTVNYKYWINFDRAYVMSNAMHNYDGSTLDVIGMKVDDNIKCTIEFMRLPVAERAKIAAYACENADRLDLDPSRILFYALFDKDDAPIASAIEAAGITFSDALIRDLSDPSSSDMKNEFIHLVGQIPPGGKVADYVDRIAVRMRGKRPCLAGLKAIWDDARRSPASKRLEVLQEDLLEYVLAEYDCSKVVKTDAIIGAIDKDNTNLLAIFERHGWLKSIQIRDAVLEYATAHSSEHTECAAWLMDYKNRTMDPMKEKERERRREKKMLAFDAPRYPAGQMRKIWRYTTNIDGDVVITGYKGEDTDITFVPEIGTRKVASISLARTENRHVVHDMKRVEISRGIPAIGAAAFADCYALEEVVIPDTVKLIGPNAFDSCTGLARIDLPEGIEKISAHAFYDCDGLVSIKLPGSLKFIGEGAFSWCRKLESAEIPEGIEDIPEDMFDGCIKLKSVSLPKSIRKIYEGAFSYCKELESIVLPDGLEFIDKDAFYECVSLKTVYIPASCTSIINGAFGKSDKGDRKEDLTLIVEPGSYAESYCKANMLKYEYPKDNG